MDDATNEAMVNLDRAELVVPLDAVTVEPQIPVETSTVIDPVEFFDFFEEFNDWPTNGLRLAEAAERQNYSSTLVKFFEGLPGSFATEADIMPYAEDPSKPPYGEVLELEPNGDTEDTDELTFTDITHKKK
jgi:hypothetical protein